MIQWPGKFYFRSLFDDLGNCVAGHTAAMRDAPSVSYTHLDVYKRQPSLWSDQTVLLDYTVTDGLNKYSVPYDLIGKSVSVRVCLLYTSRCV